jgi:spermidine synthase
VELRHAVIKIAYRYFQLPRDERLQVLNCDAAEFIDAADTQKTDMVFSDIYGADGMDPHFFQPWYIDACHRVLNDDGWLILNCWEEHREERETLEAIAERFAEVYTCTVSSGNWIIMAAKRRHQVSEDQLKVKAKAMAQKMGFAFMDNLRRLYQIDLPTLEQARIG